MVQCGGSIPPSGTIGNIAKRITNKNSIIMKKTIFNAVITFETEKDLTAAKSLLNQYGFQYEQTDYDIEICVDLSAQQLQKLIAEINKIVNGDNKIVNGDNKITAEEYIRKYCEENGFYLIDNNNYLCDTPAKMGHGLNSYSIRKTKNKTVFKYCGEVTTTEYICKKVDNLLILTLISIKTKTI